MTEFNFKNILLIRIFAPKFYVKKDFEITLKAKDLPSPTMPSPVNPRSERIILPKKSQEDLIPSSSDSLGVQILKIGN